MANKRLMSLLSKGTFIALTFGAFPAAQAQMITPTPPLMMVPIEPQIMAPLPQPPDRVEFYSDALKIEPGDDPANWSARENVAESNRYEQFVHTNPAFRQVRTGRNMGR